MRALAENLVVRLEADPRAAPVLDFPDILKLALRGAPGKNLPVELLAARDLDLEPFGQGVDDGHADAMQAAGGLVRAGIEFSARVKGRHDDFKRGFLREFRVRIDGNAAAVVGDGEKAVRRRVPPR